MPNWNETIAEVKKLPGAEQQGSSLHTFKELPIKVTTKALADFVASQPEEDRGAVSKQLAEAVTVPRLSARPLRGKETFFG